MTDRWCGISSPICRPQYNTGTGTLSTAPAVVVVEELVAYSTQPMLPAFPLLSIAALHLALVAVAAVVVAAAVAVAAAAAVVVAAVAVVVVGTPQVVLVHSPVGPRPEAVHTAVLERTPVLVVHSFPHNLAHIHQVLHSHHLEGRNLLRVGHSLLRDHGLGDHSDLDEAELRLGVETECRCCKYA